MALLITDQCINCDMCLAECPNDAIMKVKRFMKLMCNAALNVWDFISIKPV